jgi:cyclic pyranopterin phosphate synthase
MDALDPVTFARMNDADFQITEVLRGIDAAAEAGLSPIKVNMVVRRGVNDDQILPMARHFRGSGHILRFIEYMDVGSTNGWNLAEVLSSAEVIASIGAAFPVVPLETDILGKVAERWAYRDGAGEIGVISSVTHPFCKGCTRARLSPEGRLFLCLFASRGYDLRALVRGGTPDARLDTTIASIWAGRHDNYSERRASNIGGTPDEPKVEMSYIGG